MHYRKYKFGVIGYGGRGRYHAACFESHGSECIAVSDPRRPTREETRRFGKRFYHDHRELLAGEKLDFVVVASQEAQHADQALAALGKGIPVYLEKAVASTWKDAVHLYRQVVKHAYPLFVGYNLRRFPAAVATTKLLRDGKIGSVQSVLVHINTGSDWASNSFLRKYYRDTTLAGDVVLTKTTHDTDFVQHALNTEAASCVGIAACNVWNVNPRVVLKPEKRVGIRSHKKNPTSHDICCASGLFMNGTAFTFLFTTTGPDYARHYVFNGTAGQIDTIFHTRRPQVPRTSVTLWRYGKRPQKIRLPSFKGGHGGADYRIHIDFLEWLRSKPEGPLEPDSILTGVIIPLAALSSGKSGKRVDCERWLSKARDMG